MVVARTNMFMCSDPGQNLIAQDIEDEHLDRVVVAACSPKLHETTFRGVLARAGLNPYLYEHVNIREQVSWATDDARAGHRQGDLPRGRRRGQGFAPRSAGADPRARPRRAPPSSAAVWPACARPATWRLAGIEVALIERDAGPGRQRGRSSTASFPTRRARPTS